MQVEMSAILIVMKQHTSAPRLKAGCRSTVTAAWRSVRKRCMPACAVLHDQGRTMEETYPRKCDHDACTALLHQAQGELALTVVMVIVMK